MTPNHSSIRTRADLADVVGIAVLVGLTALFVCCLVMPLALHDRQLNARAEESARQRQRANALASNIRDAKTEVDRLTTRLQASALRIEHPAALNERLSRLVGLANEFSLALAELKPGEPTPAKRYTIVPLKLSGSGAYPDVTRFLHRLHETMPDLVVAGFKLDRTTDGSSAKGTCELELRWIARPATDLPADQKIASVQ